ncbi:hypothetical protein EVAR_56641_1 [Eumeta japonica]|uniref:Uncharacterized protein n=1 Tax=Eumeta variegata TaxID=151549 RepID=A0A4C1YRZ5_EUMVA|nr:hypothetical protein EVAR_56641_1 [Eumeta japonica]
MNVSKVFFVDSVSTYRSHKRSILDGVVELSNTFKTFTNVTSTISHIRHELNHPSVHFGNAARTALVRTLYPGRNHRNGRELSVQEIFQAAKRDSLEVGEGKLLRIIGT